MTRTEQFAIGATGVGMIGVMTHANVMAGGGYGSLWSMTVLAVAAGLMVGAVALGVAWRERYAAAVALFALLLVSGECWMLTQTARRIVDHRGAAQSTIDQQSTAVAAARKRVAETEAMLAVIGETQRLRDATAAKSAADTAALSKASERGCADRCKALLDGAIERAEAEVKAARAEIDGQRNAALTELAAARAAVPEAKPAPAASLASRLGVSGDNLDLFDAALASIAANLTGAAFLAFAVHGRRHRTRDLQPEAIAVAPEAAEAAPVTERAEPVKVETPAASAPVIVKPRSALAEADRFAAATLRPSERGHARLVEFQSAYRAWCKANDLTPLPAADIAPALRTLFERAGLRQIETEHGTAVAGVEWREPQKIAA